MAVKRFTGSNIREVMQCVRDELGDEAVIISNKRVTNGIEIIATSDETLKEITAQTQKKKSPVPEAEPAKPQAAVEPEAPKKPEVKHPTFMDAIQMREQRLASSSENPLANPFRFPDDEPPRAFPLATQRRKTVGGQAYTSVATANELDKDTAADDKSEVMVKLFSQSATRSESQNRQEPDKAQGLDPLPMEVVEAELVDEAEEEQKEQGPAIPSAADRFEEDLKKSRAITQWSTQMLGDLNSMQDLIRRQILPRVSQSAVYAQIQQMLVKAGLQKDFCNQLLSSLPGELAERRMDRAGMSHWVEHAMVEQINVMNSPEAWWGGRAVIALIGTNGSGKSTALTKMAARFVMDNDPGEVVIVSIDSDQHETLRSQAEILGVDFVMVEEYQNLDEILNELCYKRLVLLDTIGYSYRHKRLVPQLDRLAKLDQPLKVMLILNASSEAESLEAMTSSYLKAAAGVNLTLEDCVVSKLDEAVRIGSLISTMSRYKLRLNYQSSGSGMLEDFERGSALSLVRQALAVEDIYEGFSTIDTTKDSGFQFASLRNVLLENVNEMTTVLASIRREFKNAGFVEATRSIQGLDQSRKVQPYARLMSEAPIKQVKAEIKKPEILWGVNDYPIETAYYHLDHKADLSEEKVQVTEEPSPAVENLEAIKEVVEAVKPPPEPIKLNPVRAKSLRFKKGTRGGNKD